MISREDFMTPLLGMLPELVKQAQANKEVSQDYIDFAEKITNMNFTFLENMIEQRDHMWATEIVNSNDLIELKRVAYDQL